MYQAHYINPLKQFGKINYELLIEDTDGILPAIRQWTSFPEEVTDAEMITRAEIFIDNALTAQEPPLI